MTWTHTYAWGAGPLGAGGPAGASDNPVRAALKGQRCRVLRRGSKRTVEIVTDGGWHGTTSERALRRIKTGDGERA